MKQEAVEDGARLPRPTNLLVLGRDFRTKGTRLVSSRAARR